MGEGRKCCKMDLNIYIFSILLLHPVAVDSF
jgi:hypothetical protein